jgi:hypothetical protein
MMPLAPTALKGSFPPLVTPFLEVATSMLRRSSGWSTFNVAMDPMEGDCPRLPRAANWPRRDKSRLGIFL